MGQHPNLESNTPEALTNQPSTEYQVQLLTELHQVLHQQAVLQSLLLPMELPDPLLTELAQVYKEHKLPMAPAQVTKDHKREVKVDHKADTNHTSVNMPKAETEFF